MPFVCVVCRSDKDTVIAQEDGYAVCPSCCATTTHPNGEVGHEYEYDRGERDYPCKWCFELPPPDHYLYHPDPFDYY